jgi:hypothetical protein
MDDEARAISFQEDVGRALFQQTVEGALLSLAKINPHCDLAPKRDVMSKTRGNYIIQQNNSLCSK